MLQIQANVLKQMKMFSKRYSSKRKRKHFVLKYSDWFSRLSCFQNVPEHSVYSETFRFVLYAFQKCSGQFSRLFYFQNVLKLLAYSETFTIVLGTFQKCCGTLRHFQNIPKLLVYSETFRFVLGTIQICSRKISRLFRKYSDCLSWTFQKCSEILRRFQKCSEIF